MSKTWKNILFGTLYLALTALLVLYFWSANGLNRQGKSKEVCRNIKVTLLDSALNRFVTPKEVIGLLNQFNGKNTVGTHNDSIKLSLLETLLNSQSAIKDCQIFVCRDGQMNIEITQRRPLMRIEANSGGYYLDETGYIFPLIENTSTYIPIISGNLPINISDTRQLIGKDSVMWINKFIAMGKFIENNPYWNEQIEQIYFAENKDAELYLKGCDQRIIFGDLKYIDEKFTKLYSMLNNALPEVGWDKYSSIDLSFKNQIVCKRNKKY